MYPPGLRLRQTRETLGLTYRGVEKARYQIAVSRSRPDFIVHISRLADIENRGVVPSLHKLYWLATILPLIRWKSRAGMKLPPAKRSMMAHPSPYPYAFERVPASLRSNSRQRTFTRFGEHGTSAAVAHGSCAHAARGQFRQWSLSLCLRGTLGPANDAVTPAGQHGSDRHHFAAH